MSHLKKTFEYLNQGVSLIELLVALVVFSSFIGAFTLYFQRSQAAVKSAEWKAAREQMRRNLLYQVSCPATLGPTPASKCTSAGKSIDLLAVKPDQSTYTLLPANGATIGGWTYRPECVDTTGLINVRAVRLRPAVALANSLPTSSYLPDQLTRVVVKITDNASLLYPAGSELCAPQNTSGKQTYVYGSYAPNGGNPIRIDLGGAPQFINVFLPNAPANLLSPYPLFTLAHSCLKTASMPGDIHSCAGVAE